MYSPSQYYCRIQRQDSRFMFNSRLNHLSNSSKRIPLFWKSLFTLMLSMLMFGCSQEDWDDEAVERFDIHFDQAKVYKNNEQYELAEQTLLKLKKDISEYQEKNQPTTQKIHYEWKWLQYSFAKLYLKQAQSLPESKEKQSLLEKSLHFLNFCLFEDKRVKVRSKYKLEENCSNKKGYVLLGLNRRDEAMPFLINTASKIFESNYASDYVEEHMDLIYRAFGGHRFDLNKQELDELYTVFVALLMDLLQSKGSLSDTALPERARMMAIALRSGQTDMIKSQIQGIQRQLEKVREIAVYRDYIDLVNAIQLNINGKTLEAINLLKALENKNIYRYMLLTKYYLSEGQLHAAEESFESFKEIESSQDSIPYSELFNHLNFFYLEEEALVAKIDQLKIAELEKFRSRVVKEVALFGFDKIKTLYVSKQGFDEMAHNFFRAFSNHFNFAIIKGGAFDDLPEDKVFFTYIRKMDLVKRDITYVDQDGLTVSSGLLGSIPEGNVLFYKYDRNFISSSGK